MPYGKFHDQQVFFSLFRLRKIVFFASHCYFQCLHGGWFLVAWLWQQVFLRVFEIPEDTYFLSLQHDMRIIPSFLETWMVCCITSFSSRIWKIIRHQKCIWQVRTVCQGSWRKRISISDILLFVISLWDSERLSGSSVVWRSLLWQIAC